jgi:hypothetical protein
MRKMLWGCAAAGLAALGVGYLTWEYVCDHPGSWLGRSVRHAERAAATQARSMEVGRRTAEFAFTGMKGLLGQETAAPGPDEPQAPAEDACPVEPAVLPGAVVMCGEESEFPQEPMAPVHDLVGGRPGAGQECEEAARMPAVPEDAARMPACDDDGYRPAPKKGAGPAEVMPGCHDEKGEPAWPKMDRDGGTKPANPGADTMEVRPGDLLWLFDITWPF